MMISDAIALAREKSESMARVARTLARIKSVIQATGTTIRLRDDDLDFYCMTVEDANKLAAAIPGKLELAYRGTSTALYGTMHIQGIDYNFTVPTIRKIRLADCTVKRVRTSMSGWKRVRLMFLDMEIVEMSYQTGKIRSGKKLKEMLWNLAIKRKCDETEKMHMSKFDFVE